MSIWWGGEEPGFETREASDMSTCRTGKGVSAIRYRVDEVTHI